MKVKWQFLFSLLYFVFNFYVICEIVPSKNSFMFAERDEDVINDDDSFDDNGQEKTTTDATENNMIIIRHRRSATYDADDKFFELLLDYIKNVTKTKLNNDNYCDCMASDYKITSKFDHPFQYDSLTLVNYTQRFIKKVAKLC